MNIADQVIKNYTNYLDRQSRRYRCRCDGCDRPLFAGDTCHLLDHQVMCPKCAETFCRDLLFNSSTEVE